MAEKQRRGVHVQSCMKWLFEVLLQGKELTKPPIPESSDPDDFNGGSPNMKGLFCLLSYIAGGGKGVGRERFLNWLRYEAKAHGHTEAFSATHGQLWAGIMGAGLLYSVRVWDPEVRDLCLAWWRFEFAVYQVCEITSGEPGVPTEPWLPGGRAFKGGEKSGNPPLGTYPTRGKIMQAIRSGRYYCPMHPEYDDFSKPGACPVCGRPLVKIEVAGRPNQYDVGARLLKALPQAVLEEIQVWPTSIPPMWSGFHARRDAEGNCVAYFDGPRWKDATLAAGVFQGNRWIARSFSEMPAQTLAGAPVFSIDAPASELRAIEEGRGKADDGDDGEGEPVTQPPVPPAEPPVTPPPVTVPPTTPPAPGQPSLKEEFLQDLQGLAPKYIGRAGLDPILESALRRIASGDSVDLRSLLIALLMSGAVG